MEKTKGQYSSRQCQSQTGNLKGVQHVSVSKVYYSLLRSSLKGQTNHRAKRVMMYTVQYKRIYIREDEIKQYHWNIKKTLQQLY